MKRGDFDLGSIWANDLALFAVIVVAVAIDVWTIRAVNRDARPWLMNLTACWIIAALFAGLWLGFGAKYSVSPTQIHQGFPFLIAVFLFKDGRWIDYIGNPFFGFVNAFLIASALFLPLTAAMFVARRRKTHQ